MADLIKIKAGSGDVPTLQDREIAYNRTEKAFYIGTPSGNVRLCGEEDVTKIAELTSKNAELNTKIEGLTSKNAEIEANIEAITARLDALTPSE